MNCNFIGGNLNLIEKVLIFTIRIAALVTILMGITLAAVRITESLCPPPTRAQLLHAQAEFSKQSKQ